MRIETTSHRPGRGWSTPLPTDLDSPSTLVLAFGTSALLDAPGPTADLRSAFPLAQFAGCSTAGEILGAELSDDGLVVAVVRFERTRLRGMTERVTRPDVSAAAGEAIARALWEPDLRGMLVFCDGMRVNGTELVRGLNHGMPAEVPVSGGLAADGERFSRTWAISRDGLAEGTVCAVGLYGDHVDIGRESAGGFDVFGAERVVTRSRGRVVYELDGRPALDLYRDYLGDLAAGLPATGLLFPLAIRADERDERQLVRTILAIDEVERSLTFAGDVPEGWLAQLMISDVERLVDAVHHRLAGHVRDGRESLVVAVSCVGRRLLLGERAEEELETVREAFGEHVSVIGCYSYGEIGAGGFSNCELHNQTMTIMTIAER